MSRSSAASRTARRKPANDVEQWLWSLGFQFNPFVHLDAAADPHLDRYLIPHEAFDTVWGDWPTLVFEPPGGGKTALRVRTVQACYIGQESNRPFPISYLPPYLKWRSVEPTFEKHLAAILASGAEQLLLSLAHRPHWFLTLAAPEQRLVRAALEGGLPGRLDTYLDLVDEQSALSRLTRRILQSPPIRISPDPPAMLALLEQLRQTPADRLHDDVSDRWQVLKTVLLEILKFDTVYILVDGLDGAPETARHPSALARACASLWQQIVAWNNEHIYIKAFLPQEAEAELRRSAPELFALSRTVNIVWSERLLAEMLTQRIGVATQQEYQSFAAIAVRDFAEIEPRLVREAGLRPRNVLRLTQALLRHHVRLLGPTGRLTEQDFLAARDEFQSDRLRVA